LCSEKDAVVEDSRSEPIAGAGLGGLGIETEGQGSVEIDSESLEDRPAALGV
jgi:hypothetical protein